MLYPFSHAHDGGVDADTAKAVEALRRERGLGVSAAVNELIRRALLAQGPPKPFVAQTFRLGIAIDVSNVTDALDLLEGPSAR